MSDVEAALAAANEQIRDLLAEQSARFAKQLAEVVAATRGPVCSLTFRELWDRYFVAASPTLKDPQNIADLMKAPLEFLGDRVVSEVRRADWIAYRADRSAQLTRFRTPTTVATRNLEMQRAKRVFNWAIEEGLIETSPLANVKREPPRPARETVVDEEGLAKFLALAGPMDRALFLIAIDSGLRKTEARMMRWSQIKEDGRTSVSWTVCKTRKTRAVRLTTRTLEALAAIDRIPGCDFIFANPSTKKPYSDCMLWMRFRAACDGAGLQPALGDGNVHYHDGRHSFVTRTIENGTPPPVAMRAAGHTTFAQASRYFHLTPKALDAMAARNAAAIEVIKAGPRRGPIRAPPALRRAKVDPVEEKTS